MTTSQRLQALSEALYGSWSPSSLGRDLGVSERSVRRWSAFPERWPIPERIWPEVRTLLLDRSERIMALVGEIDGL
jgi:hypothetical protein